MSLFITYVSSTCFGPHRSIIRSALQAVFADLVCGNTSTTRHVQPLRSCRKSSLIKNFVYLVGLHIYFGGNLLINSAILVMYVNAFLLVLLTFLGRCGRHSVLNSSHNAFAHYENQDSKSHIALNSLNAIMPVFSKFFVPFGYNSVEEISNKSYPVTGSQYWREINCVLPYIIIQCVSIHIFYIYSLIWL